MNLTFGITRIAGRYGRIAAVVVCCAAGGGAGEIAAQVPERQLATGPAFLTPRPKAGPGAAAWQDASDLPVLKRRVALVLRGIPLADALDTLGQRAGLKISYSSGVIPTRTRVDLNAPEITVGQAFSALLYDTSVDVLLTPSGQVAIVKRGTARMPVGTIVGQVIDSKSGAGLSGVDVFLEGTRWRTATADTSGRYRLSDVEAGQYTLVVRRLGYGKESRAVTVRDGQIDTVNVTIEPRPTRLDELVTTATGERRRRNVPNDIARLNVDSIMSTQPVRSIADLLDGRVPGLLVQRTSGAPGDPSRLRLRGASSPSLNNDPIVVVDGIRVYAAQSDARNANLAASGFAAPSPLDYIDPNSIETIEVVKGPSATTLYGQDAANGVILVTTKKGRAGPTRWTLNLDHGVTGMVSKYPERVLRWGHTIFSQAPVPCPLGDIYAPGAACVGDSVVRFQLLNEPDLTLLGRGQRTGGALGVSGGVSSLTYQVTGSYSHETGMLRLPGLEIDRYTERVGRTPPDWMRRPQALTQWGVTSQLTARLGPKADLTLRATLWETDQQRSDLEAQLADLGATYFDRASGFYYEAAGLGGISPYFNGGSVVSGDRTLENYYTKVTSDATALTTGVQLNWRPWSWITTQADAGINIAEKVDGLFLPYGAAPITEKLGAGIDSTAYKGALNEGRGRSIVHTLNLRSTVTRPLGGFTLQVSTGANYTSTALRDVVVKTRYLSPGQQVPGTDYERPTRTLSNLATFGWFLEPSLSRGTFNLISGLQLAGGNSFGRGLTLPSFPKLGGSWLVSDEPFFPFKGLFQSLRVRTSYGRAGRQPGPTDRLRLYGEPHAVPVGEQNVTVATLATLGNTQLKPERSSELEGGFDADFLDSRVTVNLTAFRKTTYDALLSTPVPPSIGIGKIVRNIGVTRNTGLDVTLGAQLVRSAPVTWRTDLTVSQRRDEVVRLGPGVEPFYLDASGTSATSSFTSNQGGQRVAPGYPLYGYWIQPVLGYTDANGNGILQAGEVVFGDTAIYRGSPLPNYTATLSTSVGLWHGAVRLTADLLHDGGVTQHPGGDLIVRELGLSAGRNDPAASLAEQALVASSLGGFTGSYNAYYWYQQVSTTRLKAVSVTYTMPQTLARRVGAQSLNVSLTGGNLAVWSNYRGIDPNVNGNPVGNATADNGQLPQPRTWQLQIRATY